MWIAAIIAAVAACWPLAFALCAAASPKSAWERAMEEEAYIAYLRECERQANTRLNKLKAEIPGGEA